MSLRDTFPLHLLIGGQDCTFLLDQGFTFSNVDPGGFEQASFSVPKDMPQTIRGDPVILHSGLQTAWMGRISGVQRSLGSRTAITCEGPGALAKDAALAMIFIDRDLTQWQGPSVDRQVQLVTAGSSPGSPSIVADPTNNQPSVQCGIQGTWETGGVPAIEAWYDARGMAIAKLSYQWVRGVNIPDSGGSWGWTAFLSTDDVGTTVDGSGNLQAAGPGSGTLSASVGGLNRVFALLQLVNGADGGSGSDTYAIDWQALAVYGNHGLAPVGGAPNGFYPSQIVGWVLSQIAGLQAGTIQLTDASAYVVPHSAYYDAVNGDSIFNDMAQFAAWHWGAWGPPNALLGDQRPRLDFLPRPADGTWDAYAWRQQCDTCDIHEDLSGLYDGAVVQYTTVDGLDRSVFVTLDNPYLDASGIGRGAGGPGRTVVINGGTIGSGSGGPSETVLTVATAQAYGLACLALLSQNARVAGSLTITTSIQDASGGAMAPWMLRAGEQRIRIPDLPSTDYVGAHNDLPITRVEASVSADAFSTSVEIGQGANLLETFQARATAATQVIGQ